MIDEGGLFPEEWDTARDLIVFVGRGAEALLDDLAAAGQRRAFVFLPEEAAGERLPGRARMAHTVMDLFDGILALKGAPPMRLIVRRQSDPWVTDEIHDEVSRAVEEAVRARREQGRLFQRHGPDWFFQGVAALPSLAGCASVAALDGAFPKRPCFVVSPGPSLEGNVELLREVKGRAIILASTHTLSALGAHGVVADLVLAADAGPEVLRHYRGVDLTGAEALLLGATCLGEHWEQPARRRFSFANHGELDEWLYELLGEDARLRSGGSVACCALSLALRMGCDPVIFVGQDLSFPDGKCYCASGVDGDLRLEPSEDGHSFRMVGTAEDDGPAVERGDAGQLVKVQGYKGGLVETSARYQSYLIWFETMARSLEGRTMLINATEGGANLRGMQHTALADVIAAYLREPVAVAATLDERIDRVDLQQRVSTMRAGLDDILSQLGLCLEHVSRCRDLSREGQGDPARMAGLQAAQVELAGALRSLGFLSLVGGGEIGEAQASVQAAGSLEENLSAAEGFFRSVEDACRRVLVPLERAREGLG
jgi:hypothetical protein